MLLFWPLVIPFGTAVLCILAWRSTAMQRGISLAGALALLAVAVRILAQVAETGPFAQQAGGWAAPFGITLVADWLSSVMVLLVGIVAVAALVFGLADVTPEEEHHGHHPLTHAMLAGICGAFLTGDIFNMYVWFEVMLISSFGLLVIGGDRDQLDGAMKYVGLNLIATVAFLSGVGLLYGATGALNMADLHGRLLGRATETPIIASAAFLIFAFGSKAALFPVFFWLPASYHTPSFTTSALFSALLTKVGVYALIRVFTLVYDVEGNADPERAALGRGADHGGRRLRRAGDDRGAAGARLLDHLLDRLHDPRAGGGDAAGHRRRGLLPVPGRGGEGQPLPRRRGGAAADRLGDLRPLRRHLAAAAVVLADVPDPGAVAGRRAALLRLLGQASAGQGDARRRPLRPDLRGAGGGAAHALRDGADLGARCSGPRIPTATTPSPPGCPGRCWGRSWS